MGQLFPTPQDICSPTAYASPSASNQFIATGPVQNGQINIGQLDIRGVFSGAMVSLIIAK